MTDKYTVLSLGWGVQSFTLAAMAALGEIEKPDVCIHADTGHEATWTYATARFETPFLESKGIKVVTVENDRYRSVFDNVGSVIIPAFVDSAKGGLLSRQCTTKWKRAPMRRYIQDHRNGKPVELWLGISWDESQRMKDSDVKYITHRWPLIEMKMKRQDCVEWLEKHNLSVPKKSACVFCPYHSTDEWREISQWTNDFSSAKWVDSSIRKSRPPYDLYLHPSRKSLGEIDFRNDIDRGQLSLWDEECTGICGV